MAVTCDAELRTLSVSALVTAQSGPSAEVAVTEKAATGGTCHQLEDQLEEHGGQGEAGRGGAGGPGRAAQGVHGS